MKTFQNSLAFRSFIFCVSFWSLMPPSPKPLRDKQEELAALLPWSPVFSWVSYTLIRVLSPHLKFSEGFHLLEPSSFPFSLFLCVEYVRTLSHTYVCVYNCVLVGFGRETTNIWCINSLEHLKIQTHEIQIQRFDWLTFGRHPTPFHTEESPSCCCLGLPTLLGTGEPPLRLRLIRIKN